MLNNHLTETQVIFITLIFMFILCNFVFYDDIRNYIKNKLYDKLIIENYYKCINDNILTIESYYINLIVKEMYSKIPSEDLEELDIKIIKIKSNIYKVIIYKDSGIHLEFNTNPKEIHIVNSVGDKYDAINYFMQKMVNFCFDYDLNKEELSNLCLYI